VGGLTDSLAGAAAHLARLNVEVTIGRGYIKSLARPGGNITGLTWEPAPEIVGKHVELPTELSPRPSHIAVIVDPANPEPPFRREIDSAAKQPTSSLSIWRFVQRAISPKHLVRSPAGEMGLFSSSEDRVSGRIGVRLPISPGGIDCRPYADIGRARKRAASCRTPNRPIFPSNNRLSLNWSST
jgi:hypothetical protein